MQQAVHPDVTQGTSRLHVKVGILCALAVMMDGFDAQAMGFVAPSLLADWHITRVALSPILSSGLAFFGLDRVLFASDVPFEPSPGLYIRETIRCIEGLNLKAEQKDQIYGGNARRLLKMPEVSKTANKVSSR